MLGERDHLDGGARRHATKHQIGKNGGARRTEIGFAAIWASLALVASLSVPFFFQSFPRLSPLPLLSPHCGRCSKASPSPPHLSLGWFALRNRGEERGSPRVLLSIIILSTVNSPLSFLQHRPGRGKERRNEGISDTEDLAEL